jgi:SAM-dependent methyltransferase
MRRSFLAFAFLLLGANLFAQQPSTAEKARTEPSTNESKPARQPDVIYVPTPQKVVDEMLKLAGVTDKDVVYDLGCGDGRIPITAAKQFKAKGVGIDINPERIAEAKENLSKEGQEVSSRVEFRQDDLFATNISDASVVTLYLLSTLNVKLRPKLLKELKPGTRIVSHYFNMGDWKPEKQIDVDGRPIFLWTVPEDRGASLGEK